MNVSETFWIDPEYGPLFERAGWKTFDAVMAASDGECWRSMRLRENWRFDLCDESGKTHRVYLKKHHERNLRSMLAALLGRSSRPTPARIEMENVERIGRAGIRSMRVIAFGERLGKTGLMESFLVTEALAGFADLQDFLPAKFPKQPATITRGHDRTLERLVEQVAAVARKFHQAGFNHRDFYAGHLFVRESDDAYDVRLIDLQRVQYRLRFRRRWLAKDLSQLAWSVPADRISNRHRMIFLRTYFGVSRLGPKEKLLVRKILARLRRLRWKLGHINEHSRPFENHQSEALSPPQQSS